MNLSRIGPASSLIAAARCGSKDARCESKDVEGAPVVHRDLRGELNIKIQGVPSSSGDTMACWVQIVEGDLFTGVGKLVVDSFTEDLLDEDIVEPDYLVYYREGTQDEMPKYAGIHKKALDW